MTKVARQAVDYTVGAQLPSGAWWYGEADNLHWIDNFHTGYVLDSLWCYFDATGDFRHRTAFDKGADFFIANFFLDDGTPKYYAHKTWPIDIQCASQAIETLTLLGRIRSDHFMRRRAKSPIGPWPACRTQAATSISSVYRSWSTGHRRFIGAKPPCSTRWPRCCSKKCNELASSAWVTWAACRAPAWRETATTFWAWTPTRPR
jgi:hypothetical protein